MTEQEYETGVERMRLVASEKKEIAAFYKVPKAEAHAAHKKITGEEKTKLKFWEKEYDELAVSLGEALHVMRSSVDGEPFVEGVTLNTNWGFSVVDESAIPKMFWKLDESKIKATLKATKGDAGIKGIEVTETHKLSVKTEG